MKHNYIYLTIFILLASLLISSCDTTPATKISEYKQVIIEGVNITFPNTMSSPPKISNNKSQESTISTAQYSDTKSLSTIIFRSFEAPTLAKNPKWYPPSDDILRAAANQVLIDLEFEDTDENLVSYLNATSNGTITTLAGYPALEYSLYIKDSKLGDLYIKGSEIITPQREINIFVIGGVSKDVSSFESVTPEYINNLWTQMLEGLSISY